MKTDAQRRSDLQLVLVTTGLLVGAAILVTAGLIFATRGADSPECTLLRAGLATDLEVLVEEGGPVLQTGGDDCAYWIDLDGGRLVAYRVTPRDRDCVISATTNDDLVTTYSCDGERLDRAELDRYPTWHPVESGSPTLLVDLRPDRPCDTYDLGLIDGLVDRLDESGAVLVVVPDCAELWLTLDQGLNPVAVRTEAADCPIERDSVGRLRCGGAAVQPTQLPSFPTERVRDDGGDRLVVDLTGAA